MWDEGKRVVWRDGGARPTVPQLLCVRACLNCWGFVDAVDTCASANVLRVCDLVHPHLPFPPPLISWLLSPVSLWPGGDRCSALTLSSERPGPHPHYQPAPLSPWWPRSGRRAARCSSRCCCCCSACASGWLLQGAACPPACSPPAACAAPAPAPPPTPAGVRWADVTARWTWTTAAEHIGSMLIIIRCSLWSLIIKPY